MQVSLSSDQPQRHSSHSFHSFLAGPQIGTALPPLIQSTQVLEC